MERALGISQEKGTGANSVCAAVYFLFRLFLAEVCYSVLYVVFFFVLVIFTVFPRYPRYRLKFLRGKIKKKLGPNHVRHVCSNF